MSAPTITASDQPRLYFGKPPPSFAIQKHDLPHQRTARGTPSRKPIAEAIRLLSPDSPASLTKRLNIRTNHNVRRKVSALARRRNPNHSRRSAAPIAPSWRSPIIVPPATKQPDSAHTPTDPLLRVAPANQARKQRQACNLRRLCGSGMQNSPAVEQSNHRFGSIKVTRCAPIPIFCAPVAAGHARPRPASHWSN